MDFYLAASAVLPILVFADTVNGPLRFSLRSAEAAERLNRAEPIVMVIGGIIWWPFYAFAEWVSIRSLQLHHSAWGGTTAVWIALALAFVQLAGTDIAARLSRIGAPNGP